MLTSDTRSPYVDFLYYQNTYHGNVLKATDFENAEMEAEAFVHAVTFGRIRRLPEIPDCVKMQSVPQQRAYTAIQKVRIIRLLLKAMTDIP